MKKNSVLKTAALVGAMTITGAVATTTAHADTASATAQQSANTADQQLSNLKSQQTANENQLAAQNEAQYNSAANSANSQITKLQDQLKSQQASQAAQDQPALESGTAKINSAASSATASENAAYSSAVASQSAANQKELANAAQHIVTPAQKAQQESAAKSAYDKSKADLDAQHKSTLNKIDTDYNDKVSELQQQIKSQETTSEQSHDQAIADATKIVNSAQVRVNNDITVINNLKQSLEQAKAALNQAKANQKRSPFTYLKNDAKLMRLLHGLVNGASQEELHEAAVAVAEEADNDHSNDNDGYLEDPKINKDTMQVTVKNGVIITPEFNKLMSIYYASMSNYYRELLNIPKVNVNDESVQAAVENAQRSVSDGYGSPKMGHDVNALDQISAEHDSWGCSENMEWGSMDDSSLFFDSGMKNGDGVYTVSLAQAYEAVRDAFMEYLLETTDPTSEGGHAKNILGVGLPNEYSYVGFSFQPKNGCTHADILIFDQVKPQAQLLTFNNSSSKLATLQSNFDNIQDKYNEIINQSNNDKQELANAKTNLATLTVDQTINSPVIKALKEKIPQVKAERDNAISTENSNYSTQSKKLEEQYQSKIAQIKSLPTNVDQLKIQLQAKLENLKQGHEAKLADIQVNAQKQIAALKDKLAHSHDAENQPLLDQIAKIKIDLKAKEDNLNAALSTLKAHDDAAYEQLKTKLFPTNNVEAAVKGGSNSYQFGGKVVKFSTENSNITHASLPQTGNSESGLLIAFGAITSMLGLGMVAKKREY
ncbi:SEC10/PgrA surface exclusion domain-containing protein [Limosilactobacillus vaginalis]|uniref:LPXTG cell wall anchor domain-containing protein n=1 Tax=Limosilactobacillus vaginalis TaxID=1633 RepID=UPI00241C99B1|nr:SEC10/PgrA surface exclusion domain-containing protein [Limosilactobacillus vaginalis]